MAKTRILIIDDSSAFRRGLIEILSSLNAEITEGADGQEGLNLAMKGEFDLIITDIDMPIMDGIEVCRELKRHPKTRGIPVIIVSSFESVEYIDMGFEAGASAYISKREARKGLHETVRNVLSKSHFQRKQLIMVVDDSRFVRHLVEDALAKSGFQVMTAENGKKALELLKTKRPDLILSDVNMPEMNGFELCDAIHADPELSSIPFMVMSIIGNRGYMKRMIQHGAEAYVVKPFNLDQLILDIERLLSDQYQLLLKDRERLEMEQRLILASITSLISMQEAHDPFFTRSHSESVANIAAGMMRLRGSSKKELEIITTGGRLHDIGKIGIRENILYKPEPLTQEEYERIKEHPRIGAKILETIPSLSPIVDIVQYHHEQPDGKGYPYGLRGDQIPYLARIVAVADTYDALTTDRPYREGLSQEKAIQILQNIRGTQLCSECVDLFMDWMFSIKHHKPDPDYTQQS